MTASFKPNPLARYDVNPVAPPPLNRPKSRGVSGAFNAESGAHRDYDAKKPAHDAHALAHYRYFCFEKVVSWAYEDKGLGDEWAAMDEDSKAGLIKAASSISAISEESARLRQGIRDFGKGARGRLRISENIASGDKIGPPRRPSFLNPYAPEFTPQDFFR
ncbi:MAG: hypothetical protein WC989_03345 [Micavibrio sp.]